MPAGRQRNSRRSNPPPERRELMRVLHVLHHSVPYLDGYTVRSRYIVEYQRRLGLTPIVLTPPQHEIEVGCPQRASALSSEEIGGVTYYRTALPGGRAATAARRVPLLKEHAMMAS